MRFPSKETVERIRKEYSVGTRVVLVQMDDPQAPPVGTKGTVRGVDDIGDILEEWTHKKCFFPAFFSNSQFLLNFQRFFGIVLFVMTNACKMLNI